MPDAITEEISQSNMSRPAKSAIRRWYESVGGAGGLKRHVTETAQAVRQGGESGLMGAALGLLEAERGSLDMKVGQYEVPLDGVAAAVGLVGSVMMANEATGLSADLRNLGSSALSVLAYRKAGDWRRKAKGLAPHRLPGALPAHHGDLNGNIVDMNDPVLAAAQSLR
jgi:hypothetical protein